MVGGGCCLLGEPTGRVRRGGAQGKGKASGETGMGERGDRETSGGWFNSSGKCSARSAGVGYGKIQYGGVFSNNVFVFSFPLYIILVLLLKFISFFFFLSGYKVTRNADANVALVFLSSVIKP